MEPSLELGGRQESVANQAMVRSLELTINLANLG